MFSEPIGLEMVYEVLYREHKVEIFDMMVEKMSLEEKLVSYRPDVVAVTSLCIDVNKVIQLCREVKKFHVAVKTVVGGTQTYLNSEGFFDESVDYIFKYTTRENIEAFYDAMRTKEYNIEIDGILTSRKSYSERFEMKRNEYILPNRQSTEKYRKHYSYFGYQPAAIMGIGRGCDKKCRFCLRWRIEGSHEALYDPEITEMDLLNTKEDTIMIFDNDMISSSEKIDFLCDLLEKHNIRKRFIAYGSVKGIVDNKRALKRFRDLGLVALLVGYESFSDDEMAYYKKKSRTNDNKEAASYLRELGIDVWASFMANPNWTKDDFKRFGAYVKVLKPQVASISPLTPFPNLPLYKEYKDRLLYKKEEFEMWSFGQVMIKPYNMSLRNYYFQLLKTNLYVNIFVNDLPNMIQKFGGVSIWRLTVGSVRSFGKYFKLMMNA